MHMLFAAQRVRTCLHLCALSRSSNLSEHQNLRDKQVSCHRINRFVYLYGRIQSYLAVPGLALAGSETFKVHFGQARGFPHRRPSISSSGCLKTLNSICRAKSEVDGELEKQKDADEKTSGAQNAVWLLYGGYVLWLLLLPYAPGEPAWATKPETIEELVACSYNFFYVVPALSALLPDYIQSPVVHPTSEALFNFVNAWSIMFGPLLVADRRSNSIRPPVVLLWLGQVFLTNVFLIPYVALRFGAPTGGALPLDATDEAPRKSLTGEDGDVWTTWGKRIVGQAKALGAVCGFAGVVSLAWFCFGRSGDGAFGGLEDRWDFFVELLNSNRLTYAFAWDLVLYAIIQAWLISENTRDAQGPSLNVVSNLRFVPFFGLVAYLVRWPIVSDGDSKSV